jgi:hypothetical protein
MPATEYLHQADSLQSVSVSIPASEMAERMKQPRLCALRNVCQSRDCQNMNTDCPGSRKGN